MSVYLHRSGLIGGAGVGGGGGGGGGSPTNLIVNGETWVDTDGVLDATARSVTTVDVDGWNYGAETLPQLSQPDPPGDQLRILRNGGGASNYEADAAVTGLTANDWLIAVAKLDVMSATFVSYAQTASQTDSQDFTDGTSISSVGTYVLASKIAGTSVVPGFRGGGSTTDSFTIDFFRMYSSEFLIENQGEGGGRAKTSLFWDVTGMPTSVQTATNTPPVGWTFDSATPTARSTAARTGDEADGWTLFRSGAAAADANVRRTISCAVGDVIFLVYKVTAASGNTLVQIEDAGGSNNLNAAASSSYRYLQYTATATSVDIYARPSSAASGNSTFGEFNIFIVPATLLS